MDILSYGPEVYAQVASLILLAATAGLVFAAAVIIWNDSDVTPF